MDRKYFLIYALLTVNTVATVNSSCDSSKMKEDVALMQGSVRGLEQKVGYQLEKIENNTVKKSEIDLSRCDPLRLQGRVFHCEDAPGGYDCALTNRYLY